MCDEPSNCSLVPFLLWFDFIPCIQADACSGCFITMKLFAKAHIKNNIKYRSCFKSEFNFSAISCCSY